MTQSVNMRRRVEPPFSENSVGNLAAYFALQAENEVYENNSEPFECQLLQDLVAKLRQGMTDFCENKAKSFRGPEALQAVVEHFMWKGLN